VDSLETLEPYDGKLSCTVLREGSGREPRSLPGSRHEVVRLNVYGRTYVLQINLICSYQYPRMTCYLCADEGVWSSSDNVPNWVETVKWRPVPEPHGTKG
jgi:hypothetical protein